jgi:hypothetical protein
MEVKQMNRREIHFEIDGNGNIKSIIKGIKGSSCTSIAADLENLGQVTDQLPTNEFYESNQSHRVVLDIRRRP